MPILNRIADLAEEITLWRHDFHAHPELDYEVHRTAGIVADKLRAFGCDEVATGIGRTGVVGVIRGRRQDSGRVIGIRADMDALPIREETAAVYASGRPGCMHACGHDGHSAMLLGAARHLAETRNFDGTVVMIFQPAEEGGAGAAAMVRDGLMDRFGVQEVYALHNMPGMPVGTFGIRTGPIMAAADRFNVTIQGRSGHAGFPSAAVDPIVVAAHVVTALQTIVSRSVDPLEPAVVSVTSVTAGETHNVIPETAHLLGTVRTLSGAVQDLCEARISEVVASICAAFGATGQVTYRRGYPVTVNHPEPTARIAEVAREIGGAGAVNEAVRPTMGAEDFSFMLQSRPGAYLFIGNGDSAPLHNARYDFNDEAIPFGVSLWVRLVERAMPVG